MTALPPIVPAISDADASPRVAAVYDAIRTARGTDYINNFWRVIANDEAQLERTWEEVRDVMTPGALDAVVKELIYVAVSTANSCDYCIRSHGFSAAAKGATPEMLAEVRAIVATATKTNRLAISHQIPVDDAFL